MGVAAAQSLVEIPGPRITAGDLAPAAPAFGALPPATEVAHAPIAGYRRQVNRIELARWAASAGLTVAPQVMPASLTVVRQTRQWSREEAEAVIREAASEQFRARPDEVQIEIASFVAPQLPAGQLEFRLTTPLRNLNRPARLAVQWRDVDGRTGVTSFQATVQVNGSFLAPSQDLPAGSEISPADLVRHYGPLPDDGADGLLRQEWEGRAVLRRTARAGEALRQIDITEKPLVERGDLVELRLRSAAISLHTSGRAENAGSVGDLIQVRNLQSDQRVMARVIGPNNVEVVLP